jgi:Tfp pilus assembly protein PilO
MPEALALGVAALLALATVLAYLFLLVPQRSRLQSLKEEHDELQKLLQTQQNTLGKTKDTQQRADEILTSLERFETGNLRQPDTGSKTVVEELNRLILKNNLRISGGISYTQLQEAAPGADPTQTQKRAGDQAARIVQSIFPGIGVTLTVEGTYPNLRHFIRDIESDDNQFVVVNTVELEGVTDSSASSQAAATAAVTQVPAPLMHAPPATTPGPVAAQPQTTTRGTLVSLRLDMAAYFRRSASQ